MSVPTLGALGASFSDDIMLAPAPGDPDPATVRTPNAFGDDIPVGRALVVRVRVTDRDGGGFVFDYRDCDPPAASAPAMAVGAAQVHNATVRALALALGEKPNAPHLPGLCRIELSEHSWVGGASSDPTSPSAAFATARVFDAALGALGNAWPSRIGAGSCTLGAIVTMRCGDDKFEEVLPGGEGATHARPGRDAGAWPSALPTVRSPTAVTWLSSTGGIRERSGGVGARNGGNGIERRYCVSREGTVSVALDRITNPPHGVDRAGPPQPAELWLTRPSQRPARIAAWCRHAVPAGSAIVVKTAGGAGHGFPGWGVDWDPDSF